MFAQPDGRTRDQVRETDHFRDTVLSTWRSGARDVAVAVTCEFLRVVLEPSGSFPRSVVPALSVDLGLYEVRDQDTGQLFEAVTELLQVPVDSLFARSFGIGEQAYDRGSS